MYRSMYRCIVNHSNLLGNTKSYTLDFATIPNVGDEINIDGSSTVTRVRLEAIALDVVPNHNSNAATIWAKSIKL